MLAGALRRYRHGGRARSAGPGRRRPGSDRGQFPAEILLSRIDDAEVGPQMQFGRGDKQRDDS
jgi:hypothetical protein